MEPSFSADTPAFRKAVEDFGLHLALDDQDEFRHTTLEDLQRTILEIQEKHASKRRMKNMTRLRSFLEAMEQYGKVIEVFLNTSEFIAFIWGPTKFLLQIASTFVEAFDELLEVYNDIGESLPLLAQYESLFRDKGYMNKVLELIYVDILRFNYQAYKYFTQRIWKQLFQATWKTFRSRFRPIIEDLRRHKNLIETQASLYQFEEVQQLRAMAETEFRGVQEAEDLRRRTAVQDWLSAANVEEDQEVKASARAEYLGVCGWILDHKNFQALVDPNPHSSPLLWVNGIPGAGKTTLASFIIEHLRNTTTAHVLFFYCRHEDKSRNSFVALARAMIGQIVSQNDSLLPYVYEEAATCGEKPLKTLKRSQEILENCLKSLNKAYVIVDGIDECPPSEKKTIASWFQTLVTSMSEDDPARMRCIFSSQNDRETGRLFKGLPSVVIKSADLLGDITTFCNIEGDKIKTKFSLPDREKQEIIQKVSCEAKDMFLYAKLVMKSLLGQTRLANLKRELQPGRFPKDIDQAYGRIVSLIFDAESTEREDAEQLLGLLVCAKRPLKWTEIQGAISIDLEAETVDLEGRKLRVDSKDLCGSLVEIRPGGTVDLAHVTAKHYLLHQKYICIEKEELGLSRLCLQYLSMRCFKGGLAEGFIQEFILTGHYAFAEYAIAYWSEHLLSAIKLLDAPDIESFGQIIETFLKGHFFPTKSAQPVPKTIKEATDKFQRYAFYDNLGQAIVLLENRKGSNPIRQKSINNLDLEDILSRIRNLMETMSLTPKTKESLERIHGAKIFKCSRIDCTGFVEGFANLDDRRRHQERHDRLFHCTFDGCVAGDLGFASSGELQRHFQRLHDPSRATGFPCYQKPGRREAERAIKEVNIPVIERYLQVEGPKDPVITFDREDGLCWLWRVAIRDPDNEMLDLLIRHTEFRGTKAQEKILQSATVERRTDLVRRFVGDEFRALDTVGGIRWAHAIYTAISHDEADILRLLVSPDLSELSLRRLRKVRLHLSDACRLGSFFCARYLVSECGVNPFKHTSSSSNSESKGMVMRVKERMSYQLRRRGPFYNAVVANQRRIIEYFLSLVDDQHYSKPENSEDLLKAAAVNGHEELLELLVNHNFAVDEVTITHYRVIARLYNGVRNGEKDLVTELLPLAGPDYDMPDRNNCSMLMYAVLHGLEQVVDYLLLKGAQVMRQSECPEVKATFGMRQTAIWIAVFKGHTQIVRRLLQCPGVEVDREIYLRKDQGRTRRWCSLLELAEYKGYTAIAQLLKDHKYHMQPGGTPLPNQDSPAISPDIFLTQEQWAPDGDGPGELSDNEAQSASSESDEDGMKSDELTD